VALGVGLGAYLTSVSGNGAPGASSLDVTETVVVPLISGTGAALLVLIGGWLAGIVRGRRGAKVAHDGRRDHDENEYDQV